MTKGIRSIVNDGHARRQNDPPVKFFETGTRASGLKKNTHDWNVGKTVGLLRQIAAKNKKGRK